MREFELIAACFAPLAAKEPGALGLKDDAALLSIPPGHHMVATKDLISQGVHFIGDETPGDIARKLLRTNLSDLAAMGATPYAYLLGLCLPESVSQTWVQQFADALAQDQKTYGITLVGGDTTATKGALTLSLTALGHVPEHQALLRSGAKAGDVIYVSGTIGDAAFGLDLLTRKTAWNLSDTAQEFLVRRYRQPEPRIKLGQALRGIAHAAIDVSDGLVQDLEHICECSHVGAIVEAAKLPLSEAARSALASEPALLSRVLSGGDDYELLFAASADASSKIAELAKQIALPVTAIGHFTETGNITIQRMDGSPVTLKQKGYQHFAS